MHVTSEMGVLEATSASDLFPKLPELALGRKANREISRLYSIKLAPRLERQI